MAKPLQLSPLKLEDIKQKPKDSLQYEVAVDGSNCARQAFIWADFIANKNDNWSIIHSLERDNNLKIVKDRYEKKYVQQNRKRYGLIILDDDRYNLEQIIKHYINAGEQQNLDLLVTGLWGAGFEDYDKK
eukprot:97129_1